MSKKEHVFYPLSATEQDTLKEKRLAEEQGERMFKAGAKITAEEAAAARAESAENSKIQGEIDEGKIEIQKMRIRTGLPPGAGYGELAAANDKMDKDIEESNRDRLRKEDEERQKRNEEQEARYNLATPEAKSIQKELKNVLGDKTLEQLQQVKDFLNSRDRSDEEDSQLDDLTKAEQLLNKFTSDALRFKGDEAYKDTPKDQAHELRRIISELRSKHNLLTEKERKEDEEMRNM